MLAFRRIGILAVRPALSQLIRQAGYHGHCGEIGLKLPYQIKNNIKMLEFRPAGSPVIRPAFIQFVRQHGGGGIVGQNLPFQIKNRHRFSIIFWAFFASGFMVPFFAIWFSLFKK